MNKDEFKKQEMRLIKTEMKTQDSDVKDMDLDEADEETGVEMELLLKKAETLCIEFAGTEYAEMANSFSSTMFTYYDAGIKNMGMEAIEELVSDLGMDGNGSKEKGLYFMSRFKGFYNRQALIVQEHPVACILAVYLIMESLSEDIKVNANNKCFFNEMVSVLKEVCNDPSGIKDTAYLCEKVRCMLQQLMSGFFVNRDTGSQEIIYILHVCGALAYYLYIETAASAQIQLCHYREFALPLLNRICNYLGFKFSPKDDELEIPLDKTGEKLEDVLKNIVRNSALEELQGLRKAANTSNPLNFRNFIREIWDKAAQNFSGKVLLK